VAAVRLSVDGVDVTVQAQVTAAASPSTAPAALSSGAHQVTVHLADRASNAVESSWSFAVDVEGPAISDAAPADTTLAATRGRRSRPGWPTEGRRGSIPRRSTCASTAPT
jgi:hypothetical protein